MHLSKISLALRQWGAAGFSPLSLFASGEQGAWYDPSDLSTMFQDRAGTTPVTADGQPVGLILDKSKGLALGTNVCQTFIAANWNTLGALPAGWVMSGGILTISSAAQWTQASTTFTGNALNKLFKATIDIASISGTLSVKPWRDWSTNYISNTDFTTPGVKTLYFYTDNATAGLEFQAKSASLSCVVNSCTVQELAGNHASQATAAARPILQTDGTYWWLRGDGVDDMVQTPTIGWANTLTWVHGMSVDSFGTERRFTGNIRQRVAVLTDSRLRFSFVGVVDMYSAAGFFVAGEKIVTAVLVDPTGIGKTKFRKNGAANSTVTSTATSGVADEPTGIFAQGVTSGLPMPGNIYSVILINRILTTDEITETEAWVNRKIGAY